MIPVIITENDNRLNQTVYFIEHDIDKDIPYIETGLVISVGNRHTDGVYVMRVECLIGKFGRLIYSEDTYTTKAEAEANLQPDYDRLLSWFSNYEL